MINTATLRKHQTRRRLQKLATMASRFDDPPPVDKQDALLDGLDDGWDFIREKIIELAGENGEWAGYPLPIEHVALEIEPRHPLYETLNGASLKKDKDKAEEDDEFELVNEWKDYVRGRHVLVIREKATGKSHSLVLPLLRPGQRAGLIFNTIAASQAWSVKAEFTAVARLKTLVTATAFRYYLLTGAFMETSKRSGVIYVFRKCRPTLAIVAAGNGTKVLAAMCLHPIGYYRESFAGSMVPTDDLIAHLLMMRGDERKYWAKCNQHDPWDSQAGL